MKKHIYIFISLILGLSYESFAGTGKASDELEFTLVVLGFLLLILALVTGVDYLKKNGKKLIFLFKSTLKKIITCLMDQYHKIKSGYFDMSYF